MKVFICKELADNTLTFVDLVRCLKRYHVSKVFLMGELSDLNILHATHHVDGLVSVPDVLKVIIEDGK